MISIYLVKNILHISLKLLKYKNIKLQFSIFNSVAMRGWRRPRPWINVKGRAWRNICILFYSILTKCQTSSNSPIVFKADLRIKNDNLHGLVEIIFSYLSSVLIANRAAACLWSMEHSWTLPPETEKKLNKGTVFNVHNTSVIISFLFLFMLL